MLAHRKLLHYKQQHSTETLYSFILFRCVGETLYATFGRCDVIMQFAQKITALTCSYSQISCFIFLINPQECWDRIWVATCKFTLYLKIKHIISRQFQPCECVLFYDFTGCQYCEWISGRDAHLKWCRKLEQMSILGI